MCEREQVKLVLFFFQAMTDTGGQMADEDACCMFVVVVCFEIYQALLGLGGWMSLSFGFVPVQ